MTDPVANLLIQANPVKDPEDLRLALGVAGERCAVITARGNNPGSQSTTNTATEVGRPRQPRLRALGAFAAAFAFTIAALSVVWLVRTDESAEDVVEPVPIEDVVEPVPIDVNALDWAMTPFDETLVGPHGAVLSGITRGGPGFVAVGSTICPGTSACNDDAAVWTSSDGSSWQRVPHDPDVLGSGAGRPTDEGLQMMEDVTFNGSLLVAVGVTFDEPEKLGLYAAVWTSVDGMTWSRVPFDREVFGSQDPEDPGGGRTWLHSVTVGGPGFVAVGSDSWAAAVWTSPDGVTWTRVPHDPGVFGEGASWETHSEMNAVTVGGPGLVAVGNTDGYSNAAVWTSPDGYAWTRVPHDEEVFGGVGGQVMHDVVAAGPGLVAVGEDEPDSRSAIGGIRAAVWTSTDGTTWMRVTHDPALFGENEDERAMRDVTVVGADLLAVGTDMWTSPDGVNWTHTAVDGAGAPIGAAESWGMNAAAVTPYGIAVVGQSGEYDVDGETKPRAAVWTATPKPSTTTTSTVAPNTVTPTTAPLGVAFAMTETCQVESGIGYVCSNQSPDPRFTGTSIIRSVGTFELTSEGGTWDGTWGYTRDIQEYVEYTGDSQEPVEGHGRGSGGFEGLQYRYEGVPPRFTVTVEAVPASTGPEDVLSSGDDLSEWLTEAEVRGFLERLSSEYNDATNIQPVSIREIGGGWLRYEAGVFDEMHSWWVGIWVCPSVCYQGHFTPKVHEDLPDGIVYAGPGLGSNLYTYQGPHSRNQVTITLGTPDGVEPYGQEASFKLASMIISELGWAS